MAIAMTTKSTFSKPALLHLMHLVSPALPVGAYAYSQGLEYAIDQQWVKDARSTEEWLEGILRNSISTLDVPVLLRMSHALQQQDTDTYLYWNQWLLAARETAELRAEDEQIGKALQRLLTSLDISEAKSYSQDQPVSYTAMFTLAGFTWNINSHELACGYLWAWLENQVGAAIKAIPLGQTDGQKILFHLMPLLEELALNATSITNNDIGSGLPGLAMASALHETQYSRLFRS